MSPVQQAFEFILQSAGNFLAAEDFHRSANCFNKTLAGAGAGDGGGVRWSICFVKSRHSTADEIDFTAEVSVQWKLRPALHDGPSQAWYPAVGQRIGELTPGGEKWWTIDPSTSARASRDEINAALANHVLPFLRRLDSQENIKYHLRALGARAGGKGGSMRWNYPHALTLLELDLLDHKPPAEIAARIRRIRFLARIDFMARSQTELTIQKIAQACGYTDPLPALRPWWKFWG